MGICVVTSGGAPNSDVADSLEGDYLGPFSCHGVKRFRVKLSFSKWLFRWLTIVGCYDITLNLLVVALTANEMYNSTRDT